MWRDAIMKELQDIKERKVLTVIQDNSIRTIGVKWVFKTKTDGRFRARVVALGYRQRAGIDYTDIHAPVLNEITLRIMLLVKIIKKWNIMKLDVEAAFLNSEIKEETFIDLPKGWNEVENVKKGSIGKLNAALYGLTQSARVFYDKVRLFLTKTLKMVACKSESCLLCGEDIMVGLYVDDFLVIGKESKLEWFVREIKDKFKVMRQDEVNAFVGVQMLWSADGQEVILYQKRIVDKLLNEMKEEIEGMCTYATPAAPGGGIVRPEIYEPRMAEEDQVVYRSAVGTMLYLVKHSRPDLANSTRELSKVIDSRTIGDRKQMLRAVRFIELTRDIVIKMRPKVDENSIWELKSFVDSDWAGDKETRRSVTGWDIYIANSIVGWGSRSQKTVSISSLTAEYVAVTEICKEVLFIKNFTNTMGIVIKLPIVILCDNVGAMFLAKKHESKRTKYLDTQYHFVCEYVMDGIVTVVFVRSTENKADPFTKNVPENLYKRHYDYLVPFK